MVRRMPSSLQHICYTPTRLRYDTGRILLLAFTIFPYSSVLLVFGKRSSFRFLYTAYDLDTLAHRLSARKLLLQQDSTPIFGCGLSATTGTDSFTCSRHARASAQRMGAALAVQNDLDIRLWLIRQYGLLRTLSTRCQHTWLTPIKCHWRHGKERTHSSLLMPLRWSRARGSGLTAPTGLATLTSLFSATTLSSVTSLSLVISFHFSGHVPLILSHEGHHIFLSP